MKKPKSLLGIFKKRRNGTPDTGAAFDAAQKRRGEAFGPVMPTATERHILLQYHWTRVHPDSPVPEGMTLDGLVPSGLPPGGEELWFHGLAEAAKMLYIRTLNQSWSKTELGQKLAGHGLSRGIELFSEGNRKSFEEGVIAFLSD